MASYPMTLMLSLNIIGWEFAYKDWFRTFEFRTMTDNVIEICKVLKALPEWVLSIFFSCKDI